jgi:hypothetical protein
MKKHLNLIVVAISVATVFSGLLQVVAPEFVLRTIGAEVTSTTRHFFAIIGMFMALFGGMALHAVYSVSNDNIAILWASFQKFGAAVAVGLGIAYGVFSILAGGVALFDLFSGIVFFYYYNSLRTHEAY